MTARQAIEDRLRGLETGLSDGPRLALPRTLKPDQGGVRVGLFKRLSASRNFALGDRAGVLSAMGRRSGRAFRLDVRQRVIVKGLVSRHAGRGAARAAALGRHVVYLGRPGAGEAGRRPDFFDRDLDSVVAGEAVAGWGQDRHHFRFIVSPEHGDRLDLPPYVRELMRRVSEDLGAPDLEWLATCHYDTDQPHAHVLVRGRRGDGRDLVIPRAYMGYGFRARAQEIAQERLGDLSRVEAERRIWRETEADRFTGLDRRLIAEADASGTVADGVGATEAWSALTRGRLCHLERLGLATREGRRYRLIVGLEERLRTLQIRRDILRTLNQRRLESGREVTVLERDDVSGRVVKVGSHDEAGMAPWAIVQDSAGREHYARLAAGAELQTGASVTLTAGHSGLARAVEGRGAGLSR